MNASIEIDGLRKRFGSPRPCRSPVAGPRRRRPLDRRRDALAVAEATRDAAPVETCLREWRTTARALSDPLAREILTRPGADDYDEVTRPEE